MTTRQTNEPEAKIRISDFPGLIVDGSEEDIPAGASPKQINAMSDIVGKLRSRWGLAEIQFEEEN